MTTEQFDCHCAILGWLDTTVWYQYWYCCLEYLLISISLRYLLFFSIISSTVGAEVIVSLLTACCVKLSWDIWAKVSDRTDHSSFSLQFDQYWTDTTSEAEHCRSKLTMTLHIRHNCTTVCECWWPAINTNEIVVAERTMENSSSAVELNKGSLRWHWGAVCVGRKYKRHSIITLKVLSNDSWFESH